MKPVREATTTRGCHLGYTDTLIRGYTQRVWKQLESLPRKGGYATWRVYMGKS